MVLFKRSLEGFLYVDLCDEEAFIMVNIMRGNFKGYTKTKVKAAHEAYKARGRTGNISEGDLARVVRNQSVMNCGITPELFLTQMKSLVLTFQE